MANSKLALLEKVLKGSDEERREAALRLVGVGPAKGYRQAQREAVNRGRASERDIQIPPVADPARRLACLADPYLFLTTYFPERFYGKWTEDRRRIVDEIRHRARYGGDKALAAPRGEGKTSIAEAEVGVDCIVSGVLRFPLITAATGPDAKRILSNIKFEYEQNEHLLADFPEVCGPIVALEGAPQRCNMQTVGGERTLLKWSDDYIRFPSVRLQWCPKCYWPEPKMSPNGRQSDLRCPKCDHRYEPWMSVAAGRMLATRGLDSAVRGIRYQNERPDFCMIDDPETTESAKSAVQRETRETTIDKDLAGLGGPQRRVARLMLTTISRADSLSARYTDPSQKPSWGGERIPLVKRWPDAKTQWETYIDMRREDQEGGDPHGRRAHAFYVEHREEMDAGGVVSNETRFSTSVMEDGTQEQLSTLQFVHDFASDNGWDSVFSELQNDPPSEAIDEEAKLTPFKVRGSHKDYAGRVTGDARGFVPDGCQCLTAAVDVQKRSLYFEIVAWMPGRRAHIVDYGNFGDASIADRMGQSESVKANLNELLDIWRLNPCCGNDGAVPFNMVLVDSGYETAVVHEFTERVGRPWRSSMGDPRYHQPKGPGPDKKPSRSGDRWYESKVGRVWQVNFDPDWWKHRCHDAFTVAPKELPPNCVTLFGRNGDSVIEPKYHAAFGEMVCAEEWQEEFKEGKGIKAEWVRIRKDNHYLDTHVLNMVAASMCGLAVARPKSMPSRRYGVLSKGV